VHHQIHTRRYTLDKDNRMSHTRHKLAWLVQPDLTDQMLTPSARSLIEALTDVTWRQGDAPPTPDQACDALADATLAVFSWGAPTLTADVLAQARHLQRVHYAAGSVKPIVDDALWANGVRLTSAAAAIAENVADYTLGLIILGLSNFWALSEETRAGNWVRSAGALGGPRALSGCTIGVLGAGQVGRRVIQHLQHFPVHVLLYDPFVDPAAAAAYGAQKTELDDLLRRADVVTLHVPNLPETRHLLNAERFALMRDNAVFINTAHASAIDEQALVAGPRKGRV